MVSDAHEVVRAPAWLRYLFRLTWGMTKQKMRLLTINDDHRLSSCRGPNFCLVSATSTRRQCVGNGEAKQMSIFLLHLIIEGSDDFLVLNMACL